MRREWRDPSCTRLTRVHNSRGPRRDVVPYFKNFSTFSLVTMSTPVL